MKRKLAVLAVMVLALALAGCEDRNAGVAQGWVEAELIFVSPDEQGRVEEQKVREGDRVSKGQLLFTLDDDLQQADVAVKQAAVTTAEQSFARAKQLLATNAGTQKNFDDAEAALRQAKANLDWSKTRLARRRALSPDDGTIQEVYFRRGETVPPGRAVMSLLPPGNLKIRFFVPEALLPAIKYGQTVAVGCDGCDKGLTAKVSFIAKSAEYTPPVIYSREERAKLVFLIEARPAQPEKFRVGQPVTVTLPKEGDK
jgi:HlyD family secretion protein